MSDGTGAGSVLPKLWTTTMRTSPPPPPFVEVGGDGRVVHSHENNLGHEAEGPWNIAGKQLPTPAY